MFLVQSFIFMLMCLSGSSLDQNLSRRKRVVNGIRMAHIQTYHYKSFQYYVWIGRTWVCAETVAWWNAFGWGPLDIGARAAIAELFHGHRHGPGCEEVPDHHKCGGTLLTPRIVHTACHCVAQLIEYDERYLINKMVLNYELDETYQVFMGQSLTRALTYPIGSLKVEIHQLCGKIVYDPHYSVYDFAWILLKQNVADAEGVVSGAWGFQLDYAGPYKAKEILERHDEVLRQQLTCTLIGFGDLTLDGGEPDTMSLGYFQMLSWNQCYHFLVTSMPAQSENFKAWYLETPDGPGLESWACAVSLPTMNHHAGVGDSGGPMMCDGQYFGLSSLFVSFEYDAEGRRINYSNRGISKLDFLAAIKFDLYATSLEMRAAFEVFMFDLTTHPHTHDPSELRRLQLKPLANSVDVNLKTPQNRASHSCAYADLSFICFVTCLCQLISFELPRLFVF